MEFNNIRVPANLKLIDKLSKKGERYSLIEVHITDEETGEVIPGYQVPAGALGFSVVVFIACAVLCVVVLLARRAIVGGELGGGQLGRSVSAGFLCSLWFIYVIMSALQAYEKAGLQNVSIGAIDPEDYPEGAKYWIAKCTK